MTTGRIIVPRAVRHRITIALRYRKTGDPIWRDGLSENISRTGLLFRAERLLPAQTAIEMMLELPSEVAGSGGVHVRRGRVVRIDSPPQYDRQPAHVAAAFDIDYVHPDDPRRI